MDTKSADSLFDQYEAGKLSRRELIAGIGAAAVGGLLANLTSGVAHAETIEEKRRAEVLMSRLANVWVTIEDGQNPGDLQFLRVNPSQPLVFTGPEHQGWLFDSDGLFSGERQHAITRLDEPKGTHPGSPATSSTIAAPIEQTADGAMDLFLKLPVRGRVDPMTRISRVFDIKMELCELAGMFELGQHIWADLNPTLQQRVFDFVLAEFRIHLAQRDDEQIVRDKLANVSPLDAFSSHDW